MRFLAAVILAVVAGVLSVPQLAIVSPPDGEVYSVDDVVVAVAVHDFNVPQDGGVRVYINGQNLVNFTTPELGVGVKVSNFGTFSIAAELQDVAGNTIGVHAVDTTFHRIDPARTTPQVLLDNPTEGQFFYDSRIIVRGTVRNVRVPEDAYIAVFLDDEQMGTSTEPKFAVTLDNVWARYHTISVYAVSWQNEELANTTVTFLLGHREIATHVAAQPRDMRLLTARRQEFFVGVFRNNKWDDPESVSGPASTVASTVRLRKHLRDTFDKLGTRTLFDTPCGDMNWMQHTDLTGIHFTGGDIVPELIENNRRKYANDPNFKFLVWDLVVTPLHTAYDLVLLRDVVFHLPEEEVQQLLTHVNKSGSKYVMISHNPTCHHNKDGNNHWNLQDPPFSLPPSLSSFREENGPIEDDPTCLQNKVLDLWKLPLPNYPH